MIKFAFACVTFLAPLASSASAITLAENGRATAVIVVSENSSAAVRHAATEVADFLKQVTGAEFTIGGELSTERANILVGPESARLVDPSFTTEGLNADGLVIKTVGGNALILAGGEPRGTLYAVYTFLEDHVGCRWWTPAASTIPARPTLTFDNLDVRYVPQFEHRDILIMPYTADPDWSVRNKCVGELHGYGYDGKFTNMPERGGARKAWPCGHSYFTVLPPEKFFAEHPDWYSLIDGKRTAAPSHHASLCLTNDEMFAAFVENLKFEVRRGDSLWPTGTEIVSVSPPDDSGYPCRCQCEKCVAIETEEGGPAGLTLRFVNRVAEAIESEFPDKLVTFYAYHHNQKPPLREKARKNVMIWYNPINASFSRPMTDPRNARWSQDLAGWMKVADRVYIYDYPTCTIYDMLPHPNQRALWQNVKFFAEQGVSGYYGEGTYGPRGPGEDRSHGGQEMAELRAWVLAKLLWNPSANPEALVREFAQGFYGPAGEHIVAYIDVMHDAVERYGDWLDQGWDPARSGSPEAKFLSIETLSDAWTHLDRAEAAAANDQEKLERVRVAKLPCMLVFLCKWDELRDSATARNIPWPHGDSYEAVHAAFMATVEANNVWLSMPTQDLLTKARERLIAVQ